MNLRDLLSMEECSKRLSGVLSPERMRELCVEGYMPHVMVDGQPFVRWDRAEAWISKNLVDASCKGKNLPGVVTVQRDTSHIPEVLKPMTGKLRTLKLVDHPPGIYFLVHRGVVIYVGQSITPLMRVFSHRRNGREFTHALYVVVAVERLNEVEGAMIRFFKPPLNGPGPAEDRFDQAVLGEFGLAPVVPLCEQPKYWGTDEADSDVDDTSPLS